MVCPALFGSGIGSTRWRAISGPLGVATDTPGWRGLASNALSAVSGGSWAEAVSPNPAQRVSVASTRVVNRVPVMWSVLRDSAGADPARRRETTGTIVFGRPRGGG